MNRVRKRNRKKENEEAEAEAEAEGKGDAKHPNLTKLFGNPSCDDHGWNGQTHVQHTHTW